MFCPKCNQPISILRTKYQYATPAITQKSIKIVVINREEDGDDKKSLCCENCHNTFEGKELTNIVDYCQYCKRIHPISELFVPKETGGVYCKQHLEEFYSDEKYSTLLDIAKKIN